MSSSGMEVYPCCIYTLHLTNASRIVWPGSAVVWERSSLPSSTEPYSTTYSSLESNASAGEWLYSSFVSLAAELTPGPTGNDVSDNIMGSIEFRNLGILNTHLITIGRGSHFTVSALSDELEESSLVKVVFKRTVPQARLQSDQVFRTRIEAMMLELRALAHEPIRKHENIVNIQGITWETDPFTIGRHWPVFIIERATRGTLQDFFQQEAEICLPLRLELALDVIAGLEVIHACGIVHGDLKLENVLVFENKGLDAGKRPFIAKLADFGGSLFDIGTFARLKTPTQPWSAPEFQKNLDPQALQLTDIYSLGLLLWRIFTGGKHPFAKPILPRPNESIWLKEVSTLKNDNEKMHAHLLNPETFGTKKELELASKVVPSLVQLDASKRDLGLAKAAVQDAALGSR